MSASENITCMQRRVPTYAPLTSSSRLLYPNGDLGPGIQAFKSGSKALPASQRPYTAIPRLWAVSSCGFRQSAAVVAGPSPARLSASRPRLRLRPASLARDQARSFAPPGASQDPPPPLPRRGDKPLAGSSAPGSPDAPSALG